MELKPIRTKAEYKAALRKVEALFDAPEKSPEADRLEVPVMLVEKYEAEHYPIPAPDPIDFLTGMANMPPLMMKLATPVSLTPSLSRRARGTRSRFASFTLNYAMETRGLTRKDLEPYIGSRGREAEVLNRARPLTLAMIRRLSQGLGLSADVLIADYELRDVA